MITCISYGDKKYIAAAKLNLETAKLHGADNTILYGQKDIPLWYKLKNFRLYYRLHFPGIRPRWRGAGYWVWKAYIVQRTLDSLDDGDYLVYSDAGAVYVGDIDRLIHLMERDHQNILVFTILHQEKKYSKRDAFILLNADSPEYADTLQHPSGYIILKKCPESIEFVKEWKAASQDPRIISDSRNKMGKENYPGFVENRHDQTALSIIAKKHHLGYYRDPSQWGNDISKWPEDIIKRSDYPQIWYSTRDKSITTIEQFNKAVPNPFVIPGE